MAESEALRSNISNPGSGDTEMTEEATFWVRDSSKAPKEALTLLPVLSAGGRAESPGRP